MLNPEIRFMCLFICSIQSDTFHLFVHYSQIHFIYLFNTVRYISFICSIQSDTFHLFVHYSQIHFIYLFITVRYISFICSIQSDTFHLFVQYSQIRFMYTFYDDNGTSCHVHDVFILCCKSYTCLIQVHGFIVYYSLLL